MKKIICILTFVVTGSTGFAQSHTDLDKALNQFLPFPGGSHVVSLVGINSNGHKCEVSRIGRQVGIVNFAPGCINSSTNTVNPGCISEFAYQFNRLNVHQLNMSNRKLVAEITTKDDEIYSSSQSSKLDIDGSNAVLGVVISSDKSFFGGYKVVLNCRIDP